MLNELYTIYRGLESIGVSPEIRHNDIQEPGVNNITFRVMLDDDGQVSTVKLMTKEQIKECWSLGNKQTQFPAVKVKRPLIVGGHNEYLTWKENNRRPDEKKYRDLIDCMSLTYFTPVVHFDIWPKYRKTILERKKVLAKHTECKEVYELFNRYSKTATGVEILDQVARAAIISALQGADLASLKAISALLFGEKLKSTGEIEDAKRITLLLDCFPQATIDIYATSKQHIPSLSQVLFAEDAIQGKKNNYGICALSGNYEPLVAKTFPEEKVAVVGPTIIFSKNEGTSGRTVERYGQSKGKAFPLSIDLSKKLAAGISFLTSAEKKNKSWAKLPSSSLLLAYCKADYDLPLTPLITGESDVEDLDDYFDVTESVILSFKGKGLSLDVAVDFVEIIKVDKANRKVNFATTAKIGQLIEAIGKWQQANKNIPDFKLFSQVKKNRNQLCGPWAISPQQVMILSQKKYIRKGETSTPLLGISFADAMKLFLGESRPVWIKEFLSHIASQYQPLFRYCALSKLQNALPRKNVTVRTIPKNNSQALSVVTLLAVLLYKMGRTKEVYMNDFAFQLGQLCAAMDEVHIGYCVSERGGSIPNTLLGNQVYGMALLDPVKAMAFMATRRKPYDSWVKRVKYKKSTTDKAKSEAKDILNATFAHRWMREQAEKLNKELHTLNVGSSDSYKAELMLGYLAGRPFEKKRTSEESNNNKGEKK